MSVDSPLWTIYLVAVIPAVMVRRSARIEQELRRSPLLKEDGTATWSLTTLQRSLREAPDGLPQVSTFTILHSIHEAGYTWQQNRTWCKTGTTLHKGKHGVEERHDPYTQEKNLGWQASLEEDGLKRCQISSRVLAEAQLFATRLAPKGELRTHAVPRLRIVQVECAR